MARRLADEVARRLREAARDPRAQAERLVKTFAAEKDAALYGEGTREAAWGLMWGEPGEDLRLASFFEEGGVLYSCIPTDHPVGRVDQFATLEQVFDLAPGVRVP